MFSVFIPQPFNNQVKIAWQFSITWGVPYPIIARYFQNNCIRLYVHNNLHVSALYILKDCLWQQANNIFFCNHSWQQHWTLNFTIMFFYQRVTLIWILCYKYHNRWTILNNMYSCHGVICKSKTWQISQEVAVC